MPAAVAATLAIFTPTYLGVVVPGRWFVRHRANPEAKALVSRPPRRAGAIGGATVVLTSQAVVDVRSAVVPSPP